jgi:membrane protein involved in colicin uptake
VEKDRLKARTGGFERHGDEVDQPFVPPPNAAGFMNDFDRFHGDTASEERRKRDERLERDHRLIERMRIENHARDERRYNQQAEEEKRHEEELRRAREDSDRARRNKSSTPYNPLTLQYNDDPEGERLKIEDEQIRYRAALRTHNLRAHDARTGFNLITGESNKEEQLPQRPPLPPPAPARAAKP